MYLKPTISQYTCTQGKLTFPPLPNAHHWSSHCLLDSVYLFIVLFLDLVPSISIKFNNSFYWFNSFKKKQVVSITTYCLICSTCSACGAISSAIHFPTIFWIQALHIFLFSSFSGHIHVSTICRAWHTLPDSSPFPSRSYSHLCYFVLDHALFKVSHSHCPTNNAG